MPFDQKFEYSAGNELIRTLQVKRSNGTHYLFKITSKRKLTYEDENKQIPITVSQAIEIANLILEEEEANRVLVEE